MRPRTVAELVANPRHAGRLEGADRVGEAAGAGSLLVRVGLWFDAAGRVTCARFRATTCASLIAYAEAACALAEGGPLAPGTARVRAAVRGVHPVHHDRADLVALALARASSGSPSAALHAGRLAPGSGASS